MFDCVLPTGSPATEQPLPGGEGSMRNAEYADDFSPIEDGCGFIPVSITAKHTRGFFHAGEILGHGC